jgi:hypothetical protein
VHLNELSPPAFRASFPGIAYQIGNAISSPAAEIVTALSEANFTTNKGKRVEAFGPVMYVFTLKSWGWGADGWARTYVTTIITISLAPWTAVGREQRGSYFEAAAVNALGAHDSTLSLSPQHEC